MTRRCLPIYIEKHGDGKLEYTQTVALEDPKDGQIYIPISVTTGGAMYDISEVKDDGQAIYRPRETLGSLRSTLRN